MFCTPSQESMRVFKLPFVRNDLQGRGQGLVNRTADTSCSLQANRDVAPLEGAPSVPRVAQHRWGCCWKGSAGCCSPECPARSCDTKRVLVIAGDLWLRVLGLRGKGLVAGGCMGGLCEEFSPMSDQSQVQLLQRDLVLARAEPWATLFGPLGEQI